MVRRYSSIVVVRDLVPIRLSGSPNRFRSV